MNSGYVMIDFTGASSGTNPELAKQITDALASGKLIIGYGINNQSPVVLTANSSGVLSGGGVSVSVSGSTVTISGPAAGSVTSEIFKLSGSKEHSVTAAGIQTVVVPISIPTGYEIIGVGKILPTGVSSIVALALRGYQQSSTGVTVYFSNSGSSTGTATVEVEVTVAKIQGSNAKFTPEETPIKRNKKGE